MAYFLIVPFVLLGIFRYGGAFMLFLTPPLIPYLLVQLYRAIRRPEQREYHRLNITRWLIALAIVVIAQVWQHHEVVKTANTMLATLQHYQSVNGRYPNDLATVGIDEQEASGKWGVYYAVTEKDTPIFCWRDTFFREICYDFALAIWQKPRATPTRAPTAANAVPKTNEAEPE